MTFIATFRSARYLPIAAWGAAALFAAPAFAQPALPMVGTYMCVDAKGHSLTSDRPIPACFDREQKVLGPSGTVKARIAPQASPEQRAAQEARQKAELEAREQALENKRRERALLIRYPAQEAHDRERAEALAKVTASIAAANKRVDELQVEMRKSNDEMEFYRKDPRKAPAALRAQQDDIARGIAEQKRYIAVQVTEGQRINAQFDEELGRLKLLWQAQAGVKPPATTATQ